ncbi:MAG: FAD-binding protein [Bryobacteraceae bacterium]
MSKIWDVVVAGAGPAGLVAAIAARRKGFDVAVFEGISSTAPIDKCCGEGLIPDALDALRKLGIVLPPAAGMPIQGIRFLDGATVAEARFSQQDGIGVRRTALHSLLADQESRAHLLVSKRYLSLRPRCLSRRRTDRWEKCLRPL